MRVGRRIRFEGKILFEMLPEFGEKDLILQFFGLKLISDK